jgi:hypothetical protein
MQESGKFHTATPRPSLHIAIETRDIHFCKAIGSRRLHGAPARWRSKFAICANRYDA